MVVMKKDAALIVKLKKKVHLLQKKEEQTRNKLHLTLKKMQKLGKAYQRKLSKK